MKLIVMATVLAGGVLLTQMQPAHAQARTAPMAAQQNQGSASQLVLDNSTRILETLESRRPEFRSNRAALNSFIRQEMGQMLDSQYTARQVLGRHARGASDADVRLFADALSQNLMARYGSSLLDFNTRLRVRVKSETALPRNLGVRVSTEMLRQGGEPIPVDYLLRRPSEGAQWKVFDVMIEGVSMVQTFRGQFDAELQRKTIRQLAEELRGGQINADVR